MIFEDYETGEMTIANASRNGLANLFGVQLCLDELGIADRVRESVGLLDRRWLYVINLGVEPEVDRYGVVWR